MMQSLRMKCVVASSIYGIASYVNAYARLWNTEYLRTSRKEDGQTRKKILFCVLLFGI